MGQTEGTFPSDPNLAAISPPSPCFQSPEAPLKGLAETAILHQLQGVTELLGCQSWITSRDLCLSVSYRKVQFWSSASDSTAQPMMTLLKNFPHV